MVKLTYAAGFVALGFALVYNWYFTYDHVHVHIDKGTIRGFRTITWRGEKYSAFRGIPFAKPPIGELRFKGPEEESAWAGVRDATWHGAVCPHIDVAMKILRGQEDCLFLNVYTPSLGNERLPVMVWIHGGGFIMGSGNEEIYGPEYFMGSGIVLVTMNYRLGALGFLSTGDDSAPGNGGLKDQVAVLRWVRRNIAKFGGDPENVTIFGESAGAASVHFHLLSPMSAGLFAKAIGQSGSALNAWALSENVAAVTIRLAESLGAKDLAGDTVKAVKFLKTVPYGDIVRIQEDLRTSEEKRIRIAFLFTPSIDTSVKSEEVFLQDSPLKLLESGNFNKVPYITGYNSHEGYLFKKEMENPEVLTAAIEDTERYVEREVKSEPLKSELGKSIREFYFDDKPIGNENISNFVDLYTDTTFVAGMNRAIKLQLKSSSTPIYHYVFSYDGGLNLLKYFFKIALPGAAHGDDLGYLFNHKLLFWRTPAVGSEDEHVVNTMIRLWTNFAKYGNPTPTGDPLTWKPMTIDEFNYLNISGRDTQPAKNPDSKRASFWANAYEKVEALQH